QVHDVEADVLPRREAEGAGNGADDGEAERLAEAYGGGVGLDHSVELDGTEAAAPVPVDDVLRQRAADAPAAGLRADHERRGADVGTLGRPVGPHLRAAEEGASL